MAYVVWPLAIYARVVPRPDSTGWLKFHVNQALWFGNIAAALAFIAFAWPLALSNVFGSTLATLWIYGLAILLDGALFVLWLILAIRYSQQAGRGELFDIPWVARITGTAKPR
jgi:hypothetical protein